MRSIFVASVLLAFVARSAVADCSNPPATAGAAYTTFIAGTATASVKCAQATGVHSICAASLPSNLPTAITDGTAIDLNSGIIIPGAFSGTTACNMGYSAIDNAGTGYEEIVYTCGANGQWSSATYTFATHWAGTDGDPDGDADLVLGSGYMEANGLSCYKPPLNQILLNMGQGETSKRSMHVRQRKSSVVPKQHPPTHDFSWLWYINGANNKTQCYASCTCTTYPSGGPYSGACPAKGSAAWIAGCLAYFISHNPATNLPTGCQVYVKGF